jgi:hypothetical protein
LDSPVLLQGEIQPTGALKNSMTTLATMPARAQQWMKKLEGHVSLAKKGLAKSAVGIGRAKDAGAIVIGGAAVGVAQGLFGKAADGGHIVVEVGGIGLPLDVLVPMGGVILGCADMFDEYSDDAVLVFGGALAAAASTYVRTKVEVAAAKPSI